MRNKARITINYVKHSIETIRPSLTDAGLDFIMKALDNFTSKNPSTFPHGRRFFLVIFVH